MRVKVSEGKTKDVAIIDVTPENYIVSDNEKHLYHCVIEIKKFDSETGKRLSIPRIQKFGKKGYENSIADNLKKQGYTITVLHDPNEYMKAKAEADEKAKAEKAKAAAVDTILLKFINSPLLEFNIFMKNVAYSLFKLYILCS